MTYSKILSLRFPKSVVDKPIVSDLVKRYDLAFNMLKATIFPQQEGVVVLELSGKRKDYNEGIRYLKQMGVKVERVAQDIRRDEDVCYQCGACTAVCPTGALWIQRPDMDVIFDPEKCSACELCISVCPPHAMRVRFDTERKAS